MVARVGEEGGGGGGYMASVEFPHLPGARG